MKHETRIDLQEVKGIRRAQTKRRRVFYLRPGLAS